METNKNTVDISAFLAGKSVYLRPPDLEKDVINGKWFSWFNDKKTTRYLGQGSFPNTMEKQIDFVKSLKTDTSRVVLCIIDKSTDKHIGVVSFSHIDLLNRTASIAIVIGEKEFPPEAPLEAMALMTEYGFDRLNLNKIWAGQVVDLWKWVNTLELIGYRIEGYCEAVFIRDGQVHDAFYTGVTAERFYALKEERGGNICTGEILDLFKGRRKENITGKIKSFFESIYTK